MIKTKHILAWMILSGLTQEMVGQRAGVSRQMVNFFVNGKRRSERLQAWFINQGCPTRYFGAEGKQGKEAA